MRISIYGFVTVMVDSGSKYGQLYLFGMKDSNGTRHKLKYISRSLSELNIRKKKSGKLQENETEQAREIKLAKARGKEDNHANSLLL